VLSPMTASAGLSPAAAAPLAMPIEAPMQRHDSIVRYGGSAPSV
jgi:hypothetical protein